MVKTQCAEQEFLGPSDGFVDPLRANLLNL